MTLRFGDAELRATTHCTAIRTPIDLVEGTLLVPDDSVWSVASGPCAGGADDPMGNLLSSRPAVSLQGSKLTLATTDETRTFTEVDQATGSVTVDEVAGLTFVGGEGQGVPGGSEMTLRFERSELVASARCVKVASDYEITGGS